MTACAPSPLRCGASVPTLRSSVIAHGDRVWDAPAIALPDSLPGGLVTIGISPLRYALAHRNLGLLHGLLSHLLADGHRDRVPTFSLAPWPAECGWRAYLWTPAWRRIADRMHTAHVAGQPCRVHVSSLRSARVPRVGPGKRRVRIVTLTPVVIRCTGSKVVRHAPDDVALQSALLEMARNRFGFVVRREDFALRVVEDHTHKAGTPMGGKLGTVVGWRGVVVCDVNATALHLLRIAEIAGLGGRTAYGFGAVVVEVLS